METNENRFTVAIFDSKQRLIKEEPFPTLASARLYAEQQRPRLGASYITQGARELKFKPYRPTWPKNGYRYPSIKRSTPKTIEAAATRFKAEGDYEGAESLLALLDPTAKQVSKIA